MKTLPLILTIAAVGIGGLIAYKVLTTPSSIPLAPSTTDPRNSEIGLARDIVGVVGSVWGSISGLFGDSAKTVTEDGYTVTEF